MKNRKFTIGIEDTPEFHYQLAIFAESLAPFLPPGDEIYVVVCNDDQPFSSDIFKIFDVYHDRLRPFVGRQLSRVPCDVHTGRCNAAMNKVEALNVVGDHCDGTELVILSDADVFLYKHFLPECIPKTNTLSSSWICDSQPFWDFDGGGRGVDLSGMLKALGCSETVEPGGVNIFLDGNTVRNRQFREDCLRFCQMLFLAGTILQVEKPWMSEMVCYATALTYNKINYQVREIEEFSVSNVGDERIKPGSFYHYYVDIRDTADSRRGAFWGSPWNKHDYRRFNLLNDNLEYWLAQSVTDHEKYFFEVAIAARNKLGLRSE